MHVWPISKSWYTYNCDLAAELILDLSQLDGIGTVLIDDLGKFCLID